MKIRPLHDRVVIRRVEGNGTSKAVEGSIVVGRLMDAKDSDTGFNAQTGRHVDMIEVVRAPQDAGSPIFRMRDAPAMAGANGMGGMNTKQCLKGLVGDDRA
ncbi:hypothetical protein [Chelativorans sp. EGI FJ00035]|uniref:Uncharacterized protein n=1 Tax=Chelativorans salis TaxID=2978478 RepID=A0ABT2LLS9_9HYPH|nr:hypothetical protein [Chelativorans sp. EGI FJ00035]